MSRKRRALVLSDETASHWFLRSLPPHVRHGGAIACEAGDVRRSGAAIISGDWRQFLTAYCTGFVAVLTFIA